MNHRYQRARALCASLITAVLAVAPLAAQASGSIGLGGAGAAADYHRGKAVLGDKLTCGSCPLSGQRMDAGSARQLLSRLDGGDVGGRLSAAERGAVRVYLTRRFKL